MINILREVENFLITNMKINENGEIELLDDLIENSYAYFSATEEQKDFLLDIMAKLKNKIINQIDNNDKIKVFGKTMLDLDKLLYLEKWIQQNKVSLEEVSDVLNLANLIFPVIQGLIMTKEFEKINNVNKLSDIYSQWINGKSYYEILNYSKQNGIQIRSRTKYRDLNIYNIIECCEDILGYKASLVISAMADLINETEFRNDNIINIFEELSRRSRYGLSCVTEIILYEMGFNDRCLVQKISSILGIDIKKKKEIVIKLKNCKKEVGELLERYPSIFSNVFERYID